MCMAVGETNLTIKICSVHNLPVNITKSHVANPTGKLT